MTNPLVASKADRLAEITRQQQQHSINPHNFFDYIILTATDAAQEKIYDAFIKQRVALRQYPAAYTQYIILTDPPPTEHRVGNGGAVVNAIRHLKENLNVNFNKVRCLLTLSGGYSTRSPNLAAAGKAFAPVPASLQVTGLGAPVTTIFDLKMALCAPYGDAASTPGMFVAAGDILELFDANNFPLKSCGLTAIAHRDNLEYASNHGVFDVNSNGLVQRILQKSSIEELKKIAPAGDDRVLTDGDFFLAADCCEALASEAMKSLTLPPAKGELCGWTHFMNACSKLRPCPPDRDDLVCVFEALNPLAFSLVDVTEDLHHFFFHVGSMQEYLELFTRSQLSQIDTPLTTTESPARASRRAARIMSSSVDESHVPASTVVEFSHISVMSDTERPALPEHSVISHVCWSALQGARAKSLKPYSVVLRLALRDPEDCVEVVFDIRGDLKQKFHTEEFVTMNGETITLAKALDRKDLVRTLAHFWVDPTLAYTLLTTSARQIARTIPDMLTASKSGDVKMPARLVLAGGWSDTPPMTLVHGGAVFNVAVTVDGILPLHITAEPSPDNMWDLACDDDDPFKSAGWTNAEKNDEFDENDRCKLIKAVLRVMGLQHKSASPLKVRTRSRLPHGSGLGTSSILLLGIVRAVGEAYELNISTADGIDLVLAAEQVLRAGGGWQDQVGGGSPGAKFSCGRTGRDLVIEHVAVPADEPKYLCLNTRMRRQARVVLDRVVEGYVVHQENVMVFSEELPDNARRMRDAYEQGDWDEAGRQLHRYRSLCQKLAPNNFAQPSLIKVMNFLQQYCHGNGINLMGAGSGGFMVGLLKSEVDEQELSKVCEEAHVDYEWTQMQTWNGPMAL